MNPVDTAAAEIAAAATPQDVAAARDYLAAAAAHGREAAMATPAAGHLIRTYRINRCLGAIARRIAAREET